MRILLAVLLLLLPDFASALNVSARLTASLHSWERREADDTSVAHNTVHQLISLRLADLGVDGISLHAYGRGFLYAEGSDVRRRLAIYSTYADWRGIGRRLDLRLGRQRILAGVGRGTIDGGRAVLSLPGSIKLLAYAGAGAPDDRSTALGSWSEGNMYGLRFSVRRWKTTFSFSAANESRRVEAAGPTGPEGNEIELATLAGRPVGWEVRSTRLPGTDLYAGLEMDAIEGEPTRARFRGRRRASSRLTFTGEVDYRRPVLSDNSFLSVFASKANTEVEGSADYLLSSGYRLTGSYSTVFFDGDETQRIRLGAARGYSTVSYYRRSGYGGDRDAVSIGSRRGLTSGISLRGSLSYSAYRFSEAQRDRDNSLAGTLALDYTSEGKLAASIEGQVLDNKTYDYDLRLFAKVTWWIDVRT